MQIDKLHTLPFHYPATHFSNEIRKMVIQTPPYLVYYTIVDTEVRILELIHTAKDQDLIYQKYKNS